MKSKINFAAKLTDFYGKDIRVPNTAADPVKDPNTGAPLRDAQGNFAFPVEPMTLGQACTNALGSHFQQETGVDGMRKQKRWRIGCKVAKYLTNGGEVSMKPEEITEILVCTDQAFSALVSGVVRAHLSPDAEDEAALGIEVPQPEARH